MPDPAPDTGKLARAAAALTILPRGAALPPRLIERVALHDQCLTAGKCLVLLTRPGRAILFVDIDTPYSDAQLLERTGTGWTNKLMPPEMVDAAARDRLKADIAAALARGDVRIDTVEQRQLVIGGRPVGKPFP